MTDITSAKSEMNNVEYNTVVRLDIMYFIMDTFTSVCPSHSTFAVCSAREIQAGAGILPV